MVAKKRTAERCWNCTNTLMGQQGSREKALAECTGKLCFSASTNVASLREGKKKTSQCQTGLSCLCSISTSDFSFKDSCYPWTGISSSKTPVLAWDTFYNLPQEQWCFLAMLQTLHIHSKLRQQQTHYTGKKERESFFNSLPSFHFCLRKHCRAACGMLPLSHRRPHPAPPSSVLHTKAKGRWRQTAFGLQNSKEEALVRS